MSGGAAGDPFDVDEIRFSSDDDEGRKDTIEPDRSAASLLDDFRSRRAQLKDKNPVSSPERDFDNDSVVEFDYDGGTFENDLEADDDTVLMNEPSPSSPRSDFPSQRPKSFFEAISQLRSRSNSTTVLQSPSPSPTRFGSSPVPDEPRLRNDPPLTAPKPNLVSFENRSSPPTDSEITEPKEPATESAKNINNAARSDKRPTSPDWTSTAQDRTRTSLGGSEHDPESLPRGSIPIPYQSATKSTTLLAEVDSGGLTHDLRADHVPASQPPPLSYNGPQKNDQGALMTSVTAVDHVSDRAESVSPVRSDAQTVCESNIDLERRPKSDEEEPVVCSSPERRRRKKNALRHIKRKVGTVKRRHDDTGSVERKRVEQAQINQEERLKELERDKFLLESQLNQLSVSVSESFRERLAAGAPLPTSVNDSQLAEIKKEMQIMEKIIEALNEENAKLYASLRGGQIELKGTAQQMLERNNTLRAELEIAKAEIEQYKAAKLTTANESAQEEIRRLKHAMVQQRGELETKLRAALSQADSLRRTNDDLEYRLATVNYEPVSPRRQRPSTPNRSKVVSEKYEKEIAELRQKLQWYIENQKMIDQLQETINKKDESIRSLQQRVDLLYAETKSGKKKPAASLATAGRDAKRIRELENEIAQLKKQQPHKRAVSALVKAATRPDQRTVEQLQKAVEDLQQELAAKDADYMARMRTLRQECDKMRVQYDERLSQLLADKREHERPHERIRELEEQIEDMRETYRRKGHIVKRETVSAGTQTDREEREERDCDDESRELWHRIKMAEEQNRRDRDRIEELEEELERRPSRPETDFDAVVAAMNEAHATQIGALQNEIRLLSESLRKKPEMLLDRTATVHLVASLQSQLDVANRENISLKESLIEAQYDLSRLRSMPTHVQINALEMKLNEIEARHASREAALRDALRDLERQSESRSTQSATRYEAMVREKNAQILQFKTELDALLSELTRLQQRTRHASEKT